MTGKELIKALTALTPEQLELDVYTDVFNYDYQDYVGKIYNIMTGNIDTSGISIILNAQEEHII